MTNLDAPTCEGGGIVVSFNMSIHRLILIRGLPGSGKSTMASRILLASHFSHIPMFHFESDMYFIDHRGEYVFNPEKLKDAHRWCQETVRTHLFSGNSVIVSNTFTQKWEAQPYIEMADACGAQLEIQVAQGNFENEHGVPPETIEKMRARWETF